MRAGQLDYPSFYRAPPSPPKRPGIGVIFYTRKGKFLYKISLYHHISCRYHDVSLCIIRGIIFSIMTIYHLFFSSCDIIRYHVAFLNLPPIFMRVVVCLSSLCVGFRFACVRNHTQTHIHIHTNVSHRYRPVRGRFVV